MKQKFLKTNSRFLAFIVAGLAPFALSGCKKGDVGAPCNHGDVRTPQSRSNVSFPIMDCNENLCVYKTDKVPDSQTCKRDEDCGDSGVFKCDAGKCGVTPSFVLENSMCSRRCDSDADCKDGGPFDQVVYKDTSCKKGFVCQMLQVNGPLCCTKMCVCADQTNVQDDDIATRCNDKEVRMACANTQD